MSQVIPDEAIALFASIVLEGFRLSTFQRHARRLGRGDSAAALNCLADDVAQLRSWQANKGGMQVCRPPDLCCAPEHEVRAVETILALRGVKEGE